jgi:hypothetical protein
MSSASQALAALDMAMESPALPIPTVNRPLATVMHHPEAMRGAILHEPALFALFDDPGEVRATVTEVVAGGMHAGGTPTAFERFIRFVATDAN